MCHVHVSRMLILKVINGKRLLLFFLPGDCVYVIVIGEEERGEG